MVHLLVHSKLQPLTLVPIQWLFHAEIPISKILKISSTLESLWACHHMNQWSETHLNQSWNFGSSVPGSAMAVIPRPTSHLATKKSSPGAEVKNSVFGRWTNLATFERNANHHPLFMWRENQMLINISPIYGKSHQLIPISITAFHHVVIPRTDLKCLHQHPHSPM